MFKKVLYNSPTRLILNSRPFNAGTITEWLVQYTLMLFVYLGMKFSRDLSSRCRKDISNFRHHEKLVHLSQRHSESIIGMGAVVCDIVGQKPVPVPRFMKFAYRKTVPKLQKVRTGVVKKD